jgi:ABC-type multidrug transport system permease subunit
MNNSPLLQLTLARLREFIREPEAVFWAFVFPILMSVAMAVAFPAGATRPVVVAVADGEGAAAVRHALASRRDIEVRPLEPGSARRVLREGEIQLIVVPTTPPTYQFDSAREESRTARLVVDDALKRAAGRSDPWTAVEQPQQVPGSRYIDWLLPGLIGLGIMSTGMWGVGFSIAQSRMRNVLKLLVATPMQKSEYLAAQLLARLVFLGPEVAVPMLFGVFVLGLPMNGSIFTLAVVSIVGGVAFAALGIFVASRVRTFEAISGLMNVAMLPMWLLSGVFFSAANFPATLQPLIQSLPLTALNDALRAVILEGATLRAIQAELWILMAWSAATFGFALRIFRWR